MDIGNIISQNKNNLFTAKSKNGYGFAYFAKRNIKKGEEVLKGIGKIINHQTAHISIQINAAKHYLPKKWTGKYLNHSCTPNTFIRSRQDGFPDWIALRNIKLGEEINYSYWMTEYKWGNKAVENYIKCHCNSKKCVGLIQSFHQLSLGGKKVYKNQVSKYLQAMLKVG